MSDTTKTMIAKKDSTTVQQQQQQQTHQDGSLIAIIGDEDTVTGFLLAGVGNLDARRKSNFLIVKQDTTRREIEDQFKEFTQNREDIAVVLIAQFVADEIRYLVNEYHRPIPAVLEIPSPDHPYDASKDSILKRVQHLLGSSSVSGNIGAD